MWKSIIYFILVMGTPIHQAMAETSTQCNEVELREVAEKLYDSGEAERALKTIFVAHECHWEKQDLLDRDRMDTEIFLAALLGENGYHDPAEVIFNDLLDRQTKWLESNDPLLLKTEMNFAAFLTAASRYKEAEALYNDLLPRQLDTLGENNDLVLSTKANFAAFLRATSNLEEAQNHYRDVLERRKARLKSDDPRVLSIELKLARVLQDDKRYKEAEVFYLKSLQRQIAVLGSGHPSVIKSERDYGILLEITGRYKKAEELYRDLLLRQKEVRANHPTVLATELSLANLLQTTGRYKEAEELYRSLLPRQKAALGRSHREVLAAELNFTSLLQTTALYAEAEMRYRVLLQRQEAVLGMDHRDVLTAEENLAGLLESTGRIEEAKASYRDLLGRKSEVLGPNHPSVLETEIKLALLLWNADRDNETDALAFFEGLLPRLEAVLGLDHPDVLGTQTVLAVLLDFNERNAEAEALYRELLPRLRAGAGEDHPDVLATEMNLVFLLQKTGRYAEAEALYRALLPRLRAGAGEDHPDVLLTLRNLAVLQLDRGRPELALGPAREARAAWRGRVLSAVSADAKQQAQLGDEAQDASRLLLTAAFQVAAQGGGEAPEDRPEALRQEAFAAAQVVRPGSAGQALARSVARRVARASGAGAVVADWEAAQRRRDTLDREVLEVAALGPDVDDEVRAARRSALADAQAEVATEIRSSWTALEAAEPRIAQILNPDPVTFAELQSAAGAELLGADEALVLLVPPEGPDPGIVWAVTRDDEPVWAEIDMGAEELETAIKRLHFQVKGGRSSAGLPPGREKAKEPLEGLRGFDRGRAHELYQALFGAPEIERVLAGKENWILAPQGVLLSLPFAPLVTEAPEGGAVGDADAAVLRATPWLAFEKTLAVVPSVPTLRMLRQLSKERRSGPRRSLFALADARYNDLAGNCDPTRGTARSAIGVAADYVITASSRLQAVRSLDNLPCTALEAANMAEILSADPADVLTGKAATERALDAANTPDRLGAAEVVLFAVHGLVGGRFEGMAEPALALTPPVGERLSADHLLDPKPGLTLEAALHQGARIDDGLLTASEAAALDLDADWVILSACDTAAGGENEGDAEGLSGLAAGFFYAGARSLLVSHWPVQDDVAAQITTDAVQRAKADPDLTRAAAMREAMRAILDDDDNPNRAHPAIWAPFQIVGVEELRNDMRQK